MACEDATLSLEATIPSKPELFDRSITTGRECLVAVADQNSRRKENATADVFDCLWRVVNISYCPQALACYSEVVKLLVLDANLGKSGREDVVLVCENV